MQVPAVRRARHPRAVVVPIQQVEGGWFLTQSVLIGPYVYQHIN
jgi:hypothetical protein